MADIELVIKVSEDTYKDIIENGFIYDEDNEVVTYAIKSGTPLGVYCDTCEIGNPSIERKTGYWISLDTGKPSRIKDGMTTESVKCSECAEWLTASDEYACNGNYCPNCGIRMAEPQEREE